MNLERLRNRRALEALRSGVPNADAVRVLGCNQPTVEEQFASRLEDVTEALVAGKQVGGILVEGGFGTGKSHLLEYLEHRALAEHFVCSRVVISKETPLYDLGKVFHAATDAARLPEVTGQAVQELALRLKPNTEAYDALARWANEPGSGVSPIFPATLRLHESLRGDPELVEEITGFWGGERLAASKVKAGLAKIGGKGWYDVRTVKVAQLAAERLAFMPRLIMGAGFRGWVVLLDEVELIGRYGLQQRGRAYAELARWLGLVKAFQCRGLVTVAAITDDFAAALIDEEGRDDIKNVRESFRRKGTEEASAVATRAEVGMRAIRRDGIALAVPSESDLARTYQNLKEVHASAYDWSPPDVAGAKVHARKAMRSHVRRWINEWDLKRLYPGMEVTTEEQEVRPTYQEDAEMEKPFESENGDVGVE
jgi:hypothetical protein